MSPMTVRLLVLALLLCLQGPPGLLRTGEAEEEEREEAGDESPRPFALAPDPAAQPGPDADLYVTGLGLQAKGRYRAARKVFWKLLDEYPESPYAAEAEDRSGANAFLGITPMGPIGPSERRIDVALMGDGYLLERQKTYDKHCVGELDVLLRERLYEVYRPYFNFWQFNLASEHKGVDEPEPPEPDVELEERIRARRKKGRDPKQYNTALDCKAAGPQGQVCANPRRVWHYLQYLRVHDSLAIVFAQMGRLGMGGMGIATTGPRGVVVHEFGHAFLGLLDEYAINDGEPIGVSGAPNVSGDPDNPPWKHFLDAKVPGVGVYEGAATYKKGVWRPAPGCAMNSGGGSPYCPVCLEAGVLRIYERISPIDQAWPEAGAVSITAAASKGTEFRVLPMAPAGHDLKVKWFLGPAPQVTSTDPEPEYDPEADDSDLSPFERRLRRLAADRKKDAPAAGEPERRRRSLPSTIGARPGLFRRHVGTAHMPLPAGEEQKGRSKKVKDLGKVHTLLLPALPAGRYLVTAVVWDPARPRGAKRPWVLKDERGLLEDRRSWVVEVTDR
jgi:hypothetical protein